MPSVSYLLANRSAGPIRYVCYMQTPGQLILRGKETHVDIHKHTKRNVLPLGVAKFDNKVLAELKRDQFMEDYGIELEVVKE